MRGAPPTRTAEGAGLRRVLLRVPLLASLLAGCSATGIANFFTRASGAARREGVAYGPLPRQKLNLFLPPDAPAAPLVVFFHGGGWRSGERGDYDFIAEVLAARGMAVAVPDYRLWPEARWPDFIEDAARAVQWLRGPEAQDAGVSAGPLHVMGHSAGGFLAAALALDPRWLGEAGRAGLAGGVLLAAPISWLPREEPSASIFANAPGGRIEAVTRTEDLAGAPPLLLLHGTADTVVGPFHAVDLAAALKAAGRPVRLQLYEGVGHVGVLAAMAAPVRALGLARAPVLEAVVGFVRG
jgi:acetyl esterase/lipase